MTLFNSPLLRIVLLNLLPVLSLGQPATPYNPNSRTALQANNNHVVRRQQSNEICNNGIDDDNNGLADEKDFSCYYSNVGQEGCIPSKIMWGIAGSSIYWWDVETSVYREVGRLEGVGNLWDITWSSNGKLYVLETSNSLILEVDPYTAAYSIAWDFRQYSLDNSLTSDNEGNLYATGKLELSSNEYGVLKINTTTWEVTRVADLQPLGLRSAGDLCFLNGQLYLTCTESKMAIINTMTGVVQSKPLLNSTTEGSMGLVTLGDGYLYQCDKDKIYRIDPVTMSVDPTPFFDFKVEDLGFSGLCSYTEHCNAPICNAEVSINVLSGAPYCSAEGVQLFADGKNIRGQAIYEWTMPDKTRLNAQSITAILPGTYHVQYYGVTDICGAKDSIVLEITKSPAVNLGPDQMLCAETTIELAPQTSDGNLYFIWPDGSTESTFTVTTPGTYTVEVSNSCGYAKDTILIASASVPQVDIGMDTTICPGSAIKLSNMAHKQAWDAYRWSDQSSDNNMTVYAQGSYWLESANTCGIARDSVTITWKDSCTCFPLYPQVDLGPDLEMCDYDSVRLMSSFDQEGYRYHWINGSREENMVANRAGMYWLEVSTYCGTVRDSIAISYKLTGCERIVYIPTAFTPNNDGKNDIFKPLVLGIPETYQFSVYNRFGQIVFQTRNILKGWDGSFNGKIQDQNMFVWTCTYRFSGQDYVYRKGSVILIR